VNWNGCGIGRFNTEAQRHRGTEILKGEGFSDDRPDAKKLLSLLGDWESRRSGEWFEELQIS
jgi:hypothetical protein